MAMENWRWFSLEKTVDQRNTGLDPAHGKSGHLSFRLRGRHAPGEHAQKKGDESGDIPYFLQIDCRRHHRHHCCCCCCYYRCYRCWCDCDCSYYYRCLLLLILSLLSLLSSLFFTLLLLSLLWWLLTGYSKSDGKLTRHSYQSHEYPIGKNGKY